MKVLVVGSGGREHAIAWKVAQSPRLAKLWVAPGNAGTAALGENVALSVDDLPGMVRFAAQQRVDLVIVGPEAPLADGLADALAAAGVRVFGPTQAAAQIESSKAFARAFMDRWQIPGARFAAAGSYEEAMRALHSAAYPVVIKASGLAAGKGVIIPETMNEAEAALKALMLDKELGDAAAQVVIEERLFGQEVSALAFSDGKTVRPMPPAQDHKRVFDEDKGPNTGGMGAYAPAPVCTPELLDEIVRSALQPAVDGLRAEGAPFVGVLYAGMILTAKGPRVLEYNCRFGDPETQAILPLLETDLLDIVEACLEGRLAELELRWKAGSAACVALAAPGYPGSYPKGMPLSGLDADLGGALVFHAGTKLIDGGVVASGGRVLGVTATGENLQQALDRAYRAVGRIHFEGMHYRKDIGQKALRAVAAAGDHGADVSAYARSGVDIEAGNRAVAQMSDAVRSTYGQEVLAGIGAFGGLFSVKAIQGMDEPVLVASIDGVGTKVKLAARLGRFRSLGHDLVNHCINDILVQGARPLFFLDYIAMSRLLPEAAAEVVSGISEACRLAGCALLGGETAEMPGVYVEGELDVAGAIVGVVERKETLPRSTVRPGDLLLGLRSSGPHTNGYSLIRRIFAHDPLEEEYPELGCSLGEALLAPHRSYLPLLLPLIAQAASPVKALAHLTGGGFIENIPRVLPQGVGATIHLGSWPVPPLFGLIQRKGRIDPDEMHRVFNMGIGMAAVVSPEDARTVQEWLPEESWIIGELTAGAKKVTLA